MNKTLFYNDKRYASPIWVEVGESTRHAERTAIIAGLHGVTIPDAEGRVPYVYLDGRVEWKREKSIEEIISEGHTQ